ncbi:ubiquitin-like modifier-activating enzyme ATG7 [Scaptodrosophila lebanonensis]|uniref:Ubiquitin-like modifier-activating enzyme ATG7 n=1 Tax=Drosophila lebanonensis TaxID=7225 RepID=A0A6J2U4Z8_DROLE|nr:ubiquitin-like modifier-activating enzyme ATG7 [Scaptodrosophila lebanonensis]
MTENILQFAAFESFVCPTFWHKLAELKIEHDRLSDAPKPISGHYTNHKAAGCLLEVDYSAYNSSAQPPKFSHNAVGTIYNKNTIEEFKELDKTSLLSAEGQALLADMTSARVLDNPSLLARFFVLSFADLKCHSYYYWFGFPCPLTHPLQLQSEAVRVKDLQNFAAVAEALRAVPSEAQNFFILYANEELESVEVRSLSAALTNIDNTEAEHYYYCFADPSEYEHPAWLMRNYVAFLLMQCPTLLGKTLKFLGLRYDQQMNVDNSLIWKVVQNDACDLTRIENVKFVGWEPNRNCKMGPRMVSMRDSMDPAKLAENSVNLNLKLMKWRLLPELNLEAIAQTKCLLFGAGTLGCAVARNLLSWGFKHITLLDSGKVGYSNPVRQNLYTHADAVMGNKMKSTTAAERLLEINPSAVAKGYVVQIPMPGHTIGEAMLEQTTNDLTLIEEQVHAHDVLFLLTDSRESRWLPTVLGAVHQKIVINAALGFDSYLVMRHGSTRECVGDQGNEIEGLKCIMGQKLGCYFCNDVTAPGNSLKDRTLDQQCTVTRPGVSNIAASYAVELLVALLQHPQRELAPAYYAQSSHKRQQVESTAAIPEGLLGILPHSIRGLLYNYENILPATEKFSQCIACSQPILASFRSEGHAFLLKAFETARYLEELTGIADFKSLHCEIIDFDDDEFDMSEGDENDSGPTTTNIDE